MLNLFQHLERPRNKFGVTKYEYNPLPKFRPYAHWENITAKSTNLAVLPKLLLSAL